MNSNKLIFWFGELGKEHNNLVGKKCANLGVLTQLGLPVPPGFAISVDVYKRFVQETGALEEISRYVTSLGELKGQGITLLEKVSQTIQGIIKGKDMPPGIKGSISAYYSELCQKAGTPDVAVSVRSAGAESRPGMFETYLNVKGTGEVLDKVKRVWASAYTPRAIAFRANMGFPVIGDELGVAIPKMVNARSSGVCFTVNPVTGDDSRSILEANWGLGEGVVSGSESVDGFVVDKGTLEIVTRHIGCKIKCFVNLEQGAEWVDVPEKMQMMPSLSDKEVQEIVKIGKSVEEKLGCAQDMEWAIDRDLPFPDNIFWLQTRPAKVQPRKSLSTTARIVDLIARRV